MMPNNANYDIKIKTHFSKCLFVTSMSKAVCRDLRKKKRYQWEDLASTVYLKSK